MRRRRYRDKSTQTIEGNRAIAIYCNIEYIEPPIHAIVVFNIRLFASSQQYQQEKTVLYVMKSPIFLGVVRYLRFLSPFDNPQMPVGRPTIATHRVLAGCVFLPTNLAIVCFVIVSEVS